MKRILVCFMALLAFSVLSGCKNNPDDSVNGQESSVTKEEMQQNDVLALYGTYLPGSVTVESVETGYDPPLAIDDIETIQTLWNTLDFNEWGKTSVTEEPESMALTTFTFQLPGSEGEVILYNNQIAKAGDEFFLLPDGVYEDVSSMLKKL